MELENCHKAPRRDSGASRAGFRALSLVCMTGTRTAPAGPGVSNGRLETVALALGRPRRGRCGMGDVLSRRSRDPGPLGHRLGAGRSVRGGAAGSRRRAGRSAGQRRRRRRSSPRRWSTATINDSLSAIGTGRANNSVIVKPYTSGRLTEIRSTSGHARSRSGTVIARLDSEAEEIALDRAKIALDDAEAKLDRINALRTSNTATAVQVTDAELASSNARLAAARRASLRWSAAPSSRRSPASSASCRSRPATT